MNWANMTPEEIRYGVDANGNRLVEAFARDYKNKVGLQLNIGCPSCFLSAYKEYCQTINSTTMKKVPYKVKPIYNGINMRTKEGKHIQLSNASQDVETAVFFLENHPKGEGLFDILPDVEGHGALQEATATLVKNHKRGELNEMADALGIDAPENLADKTAVAKLIAAAELGTGGE